ELNDPLPILEPEKLRDRTRLAGLQVCNTPQHYDQLIRAADQMWPLALIQRVDDRRYRGGVRSGQHRPVGGAADAAVAIRIALQLLASFQHLQNAICGIGDISPEPE